MKRTWFALPALLFFAAVFLVSCGFQPLYGRNFAAETDSVLIAANFNDIEISAIPDRSGQYLRNALTDRFYRHGYPAAPRWSLDISPVQESRTNLDITKADDTTRAQLRLEIGMALRDEGAGKAVLTRTLSAVTSYNILQSQFTTRVSEQAAREAALDELARQIEQQLALYFTRSPPSALAQPPAGQRPSP